MSLKNNIFDWLSVAIISAIDEITEDNIENETGSGKVMWAKQGNAQDGPPFVSLHIIMFDNEEGLPEVRETYDTDDGPGGSNEAKELVENIYYRGVGTVSVDVYGPDAVFHCTLIKAALQEALVIEAMNRAKIGLMDTDATQELSAVLDTQWEGRATFVIRFHYAYVKQKAVGTIGTVRVIGTNADTDDEIVNTVISEP